MKHLKYLMGLIVAMVLSGCVPTRFAWSPDGKWMTVIGDDGSLHIADADGKLGGHTLVGVSTAAWFPDSNRIVVGREIEVSHWDEAVKYLSPVEIQKVIALAGPAHDFAETYDWKAPNAGTWDAFYEAMMKRPGFTGMDAKDEVRAGELALNVRDHADEAFLAKLPVERRKELEAVKMRVNVIEVCSAGASGIEPGKRIMSSLKPIHDLRVSPTGMAVLVSTEGSNEHDSVLSVVPADGSRSTLRLSDRAAWYGDWSPDGRDVYFIRANIAAAPNNGAERLGSLSQARVVDDRGAISTTEPPTDDLAGLMYSEYSRVRCLKTGQVVFASGAVTLPATNAELPDRPELFLIDPAQPARVIRLLPERAADSIGNAAQYFEISPDGWHASIPSTSGQVCIVDLRNGTVSAVQPHPVISGQNQNELFTVPQWRSNDELTFLAPGAKGRPAVELWSISRNTGKILSDNWPIRLLEPDVVQSTTSKSK